MGFCDRLKEARLAKNYTQEQLAEIIGVAKTTYTGYEKGNREPNMLTISKLLKALAIDANYLWQDETTFPFELTYDEMEHLVKRYRELDTHGKEMVDFTLDKEYERSKSEKEAVDEDKIIPFPQYPTVTLSDIRTFKARNRRANLTEEEIAARLFIIWGDD